MRQDLNEIKKVFEKHDYRINTIISDVMKKFKFKTLCCQNGLTKSSGFCVSEIIVLLIIFPIMMLKSVHDLYKSEYKNVTEMKKDTFYRLKNNEHMPWRRLLYSVSKTFVKLTTNKDIPVAENSSFIVDDTSDCRVGFKIENISTIHDHANRKSSYQTGFKDLVLAYFDGKSTIPLDFSIHKEKSLSRKQKKDQFKKECVTNSNGSKRRKECNTSKITNSVNMIKRAVKNGFVAKYVLVDSWFTSKNFILEIKGIHKICMNVIGGIKNDKRKYNYEGQDVNANELREILKVKGKQKRCRNWNTRYFEVIVHYAGIGDVKLYICRMPYQSKWRVFISTDTSLGFTKMMEIYSIRWTIEVMFRELKQHLKFGKCQSRDFDAQIASITLSMILYVFLAYCRRMYAYETLGGTFQFCIDEVCEKNLAQRIWELFDELLSTVIEIISRSGNVDLAKFKVSVEYQHVKELFEESFLCNQLALVN